MMGRLDGKVCVITGAGGGMGREAALLFSGKARSVCAADIDGEAAEQTAARRGDAFAMQVDVADEDERAGDDGGDGRALRRHRRPLQQRRHLAGRRRLDPRDRASRRGTACRP